MGDAKWSYYVDPDDKTVGECYLLGNAPAS